MDAEQKKVFKEICARINEVFKVVWERIKKLAKTIWGIWCKSLGYKRKAKVAQMRYYQSISADKSNNWRKMHGLPLVRSRT